MLTNVYLDGEMGRRFGKKWRLEAHSPGEALRLIDANNSGLMFWIRDNLEQYAAYRVICKYRDGSTLELDAETFQMSSRRPASIRFVPLIAGAGGGGVGQIIVGAVMLYIAIQAPAFLSASTLTMMKGAALSMMLGGVIQVISAQPKTKDTLKFDSHYFNGAENPTRQGLPVKLVYGRLRSGAQPISATVSIDQLMN